MIKFDDNGVVTESLWDPGGKSHPTITSVREHKGYLYIGGLENNRIGRIRLPNADQTTLLGRSTPRTRRTSLVGTSRTRLSPFVSALDGRVSQTQAGADLVTVHLALRLRGGPHGAARIDLQGIPGDQGVGMTASGVSFVPATTRQVYTGKVVGLAGTQVVAEVRNGSGDRLRLQFELRLGCGQRDGVGARDGVSRS